MKTKHLIFILLLSTPFNSFGQEAEKETSSNWTKGAVVNINTAQTGLTNWVAGGQNFISLNSLLNAHLKYEKDKLIWENTLDMGYGLIKQGKQSFFKSDDKIELNSKLGNAINEKLSATGLVNFKSQMTEGYSSPEDLTIISDLLSPAYLLAAVGIDAKLAEGLSLYLSPVSGKMTLVKNEALMAAGSFGLDPGKSVRTEFGAYIRAEYKGDLMQNISLQTKLDLFSNYLDGPQYVDVNWSVLIMMKINKYISASINTQLIYDHDILIGHDTSGDMQHDDFYPDIQFKEIIGVGLTFSF